MNLIINTPDLKKVLDSGSIATGLSSPLSIQSSNNNNVKGAISFKHDGIEILGQAGGVNINGDTLGVVIKGLLRIDSPSTIGSIDVFAPNRGLQYSSEPSGLQNLSLVHKSYVDIKANSSEQSTITFDKPTIYNSPTIPASYDGFTSVLTNARIGVIQKIYHLDNFIPVFPANWVLIGYGTYVTNVLNIIYAEWIEDERVEYWIIQQA